MTSHVRQHVAIAAVLVALSSCGGGAADTTSPNPVLTSVSVTAAAGASTALVTGQSVQLVAAPHDQSGGSLSAQVTWSSSATSVASVSDAGLVSAVGAGSATITATATTGATVVTGDKAVSVAAPALTSVSVSGGASVQVNATLQLAAAPLDQAGSPIAATVTWSSNATGVATVDNNGLVTGVAAGAANITALATLGNATASSFRAVTVGASAFPGSADVSTSGLSFTPSTVDIAAGGTVNWSGLTGHTVSFSTAGSPSDISGPATGSRTFNTAGTYAYFCSVHGLSMSGTVVVH